MQDLGERLSQYRRDAEALVAGALQDCKEASGSAMASLQSGLADVAAEVHCALLAWH